MQDLYLARKHRDAAAAVPFEFIDRTSLIGPRERIRDRLVALRRGRSHHAVASPRTPATLERAARRSLRTMAEVLDESGLAELADA